MLQKTALKIMQDGHNVFLTGSAGAGKSYTLQKFIEWALAEGKAVAITASTGIAATHIEGQTIHAFSGMGIAEVFDASMFDSMVFKRYKQPQIKRAEVLIIDEISMLSHVQFEIVDKIFRHVKAVNKPFGGVQLILCGDFFQLPPIDRGNRGKVHFAIDSPSWRDADIKICYLTEQHRQRDSEFNDLLESIRSSNVQKSHEDKLKSRVMRVVDDMDTTNLYTTNRDVERYNLRQLDKIDQPTYTFHMKEKGSEKNIATLKRNCLAPQLLQLKVGALVMALKNDLELRYVNGSIGHVRAFVKPDDSKGQRFPEVEFLNGETLIMKPDVWDMQVEGKSIAKLTQVPLRLAWAITVHKSQGMTLDRAHIDLSSAFTAGQGYVALSRLRSINDLTLQGFNEVALQVSDKAGEIDTYLRAESALIDSEYAK